MEEERSADMTDPKPLLQDSTTSEMLRSILAAHDAHEPSPADLARLTKRMASALPPGALPATTAPAVGIAKVAVGVALVAAMAGMTLWLTRERRAPVAVMPVATSSALVEAPPLPAIVRPGDLPDADAGTPARPKMAAAPETELLARAHDELLRGAPEKALAITAEHARAYPRGAFRQEREVIAIEALIALGRRDEARRRAASFEREYPTSSHRDRVERLVNGP
jgi:hypothetical protein